MKQVEVKSRLKGNMAFEMNLDGFNLITDASEEIGGNNLGPRPKQLLLSSLIGCTGIDVMSILDKMKVDLDDVFIDAITHSTDDTPSVYENIKLVYTFVGKDLPKDKIERAVKLSQEKYCGVSAMLEKVTPITYEIILKDQ